jgi:hypothetical protein
MTTTLAVNEVTAARPAPVSELLVSCTSFRRDWNEMMDGLIRISQAFGTRVVPKNPGIGLGHYVKLPTEAEIVLFDERFLILIDNTLDEENRWRQLASTVVALSGMSDCFHGFWHFKMDYGKSDQAFHDPQILNGDWCFTGTLTVCCAKVLHA